MTTRTAAVAVGAAADRLVAQQREPAACGDVVVVRHRDLVVVRSTRSPWVSAHDDGDVLAVVDGRLHHLGAGAVGQAQHVVERYRERGAALARGLLGDFVLIVLDRTVGSLVVARDPLGVRPWYLATVSGGHAGAADMATLATLPGVDTEVDEATTIEYLAAVHQSRGPTVCRGIRTLPPGHSWQGGGGRASTFAHHRWRLEPDLDISWDDAAERCRTVLDDAVRCRLEVGGPATSELSGGLDSSAVVGTIARLGHDDLLAGRLIFDGPDADERRYSDAVAEHWGIPLVSAPPWLATTEESVELTRSLRRPLPDPHFTMFTNLHRALLARGRSDSLTGLGGDDAFATSGIGSCVVSAVQLRDRSVIGRLLRATVRHPRRAWPELYRPVAHHLAPWRGDTLPFWVTSAAAERAGLPELFRRAPERVTGIAAIDERIANLTSGYDAAVLELAAVVADAAGRRASHPYLDPRFIEATYGLDPWWPTRSGHTRALQVAAYTDRLPALVAERRSKAGFAEAFWPRLLDEETRRRVSDGPLTELGWLDLEGFSTLVQRARSQQPNAAIPLSRCVAVDHWLRTR